MKNILFYTLLVMVLTASPTAHAQSADQREASPREPRLERATTSKATTTRPAVLREAGTRATTTIAERRALHASTTADRRAIVAERIAAKKLAIASTTHERLTQQVMKIQTRINNAVNKLEMAMQKIDARVQLLATRGIDVSDARRHLDEAKEMIASIRDTVGDIDISADFALTDEKPREKWQEFHTEFQDIKTDMRTVGASLRAAVASLKKSLLSNEDEQGASAAVRESDSVKKDKNTEDTAEETVEANTTN